MKVKQFKHGLYQLLIQHHRRRLHGGDRSQWRRAIEALEARALPDSIATVVNTPCPGKKITVFSASLQQM